MKILKKFLFLALLATTSAQADMPSVHGMLVFGDGTSTYASHLPMFHAPHDYQLILKISLKSVPGSKAVEAHAKAKAQGKTLFTIEPQVMDLTSIMSGVKTQFTAAIYDGHFERGGQNLGKLQVQIDKIVLSKKLNPQLGPDRQPEKYFVFGEKGQYFAAHLIKGKPSFDAILQVNQPYELKFAHCPGRLCGDEIPYSVQDERLPISVVGPQDPGAFANSQNLWLGAPLGAQAGIKSAIYVEEGDLSH